MHHSRGEKLLTRSHCNFVKYRNAMSLNVLQHYFLHSSAAGAIRIWPTIAPRPLQLPCMLSPHSISLAGRKPAESWLKAG